MPRRDRASFGQALFPSHALAPICQSLSGKKLSDLLQDGSVNIPMLKEVSAAVSGAIPTIKADAETISSLPKARIPQVQAVLDKVQEPLGKAGGMLDQLQPILNVLPQMFGEGGQRSYLIIAQNNSELRATGGLPGSWGVLTVTDGKIEMNGDFTSILHQPGLQVQITEEERAASGSNMDVDPAQVNTIPDFSRVGALSRDFWAQAGYGNVDGVIAIDPVFLQRLLSLTGGFTAADGSTIDGTTTYAVTTTITNIMTPEQAATAPDYVRGYNEAKRSKGDMITMMMFYAPVGGTITNMNVNGYQNGDWTEASLQGHQVLRGLFQTDTQETTTFTYNVVVPAGATQVMTLRTTPLAQESLM